MTENSPKNWDILILTEKSQKEIIWDQQKKINNLRDNTWKTAKTIIHTLSSILNLI